MPGPTAPAHPAPPRPAIAATQSRPAQADPFYAIDRIHEIRIELSKDDWDALQPQAMTGFLQMDFPERDAKVRVDGQTLDVKLRFKGNGTYMMSGGFLKRPFKLEPKSGRVFELPGKPVKLNLNNNIMDASGLREAVAYDVFRRLGVPAPRTSFARVVLNVPGVADKKTLGLYTLAEQIDDRFLARHFGKAPTLVLKPEGAIGMPRQANWKTVERMYDPKGKPTAADKKRFQAFLEWLHGSSDTEFAAQVGDWVDVDAFAKFLAGTVVTASLDSILMGGHNYYMVLHPATGKFHFLPWDLDLAFGGFPLSGIDPLKLSIDKPAVEREVLIRRFLAVPRCKVAYVAACKQVVKLMQASEPLRRSLEQRVAAVVKQEDRTRVPGGVPGMGGFPPMGPGGPGGGPGGFPGFGGRPGQAPGFPGGGPGNPPNSGPGAGIPGAGFPGQAPRPGGGPGGFPGFGGPPGAGPGGNRPGPFGMGGPNPFDGMPLVKFLQERPKQVLAQLAGKAPGEQPRGMMMPGPGGPGGPGGGRPPGGGPGGFPGFDISAMVASALGTFLGETATEFDRAGWETAWRKRLAGVDSDSDGSIRDTEWDAFVEKTYANQPGIARIFPVQVRDAFGDSPFSIDSALSTVGAWFGRFDTDKDGKLVRKEFGQGLMETLPPPDFSKIPNLFGGQGGFPGGFPGPGGGN